MTPLTFEEWKKTNFNVHPGAAEALAAAHGLDAEVELEKAARAAYDAYVASLNVAQPPAAP